MSPDINKYLGLKVPDNYDVRYRTYYADLYDINTKSYLGTCKIMDGVTVDYTRWQDLNNAPDLDIYVGEKMAPAGNFKFTVEKKPSNTLDTFTVTLTVNGTGNMIVNWGPGQPTVQNTLTGDPLVISHEYPVGKDYQIEIGGDLITDISIAPASTGQVTKILDFGEVGLESVQLSSPGQPVTYGLIPLKLAPTIKSLNGFCRGMVGIYPTLFDQWDFSNVEDLTDFARGATDSDIVLVNKTFTALTKMDNMFAEVSASKVTFRGNETPLVTSANMLFMSSIDTDIVIDDISFPEVTSSEYWIAGADHIELDITDLSLPKLTTANSLFGEANDHRITVNGLETPLLKVANRMFASLGTTDPESVRGLSIVNWDMSSLDEMIMTFAGWESTSINVDLMTTNLLVADQLFANTRDVAVTAPNLTLKANGTLNQCLSYAKGTSTFDVTYWEIGSNSSITHAFTTWCPEEDSVTVDASNLTIGDSCEVDYLTGLADAGTVKMNTVTVGNGVNLDGAFGYFNDGTKLTLLQWTIGDNCNLSRMFQHHQKCELLASNWTIGDNCEFESFSAHTLAPESRTFTDFTIGKGKLLGTNDALFAFIMGGTVKVRNWKWGTDTNLVQLAAYCENATLDFGGNEFDNGTTLTDSFFGCVNCNVKVGGWKFKSVALVGQFSNMTGSIEGLVNWDTSTLISLERLVAGATISSGIEGLVNWNISNVLSCKETFMNFNPSEDFPNIANWNFASNESFERFAAYSGAIRFDMGHWQTGSATNMDLMFTGQSEVITNQDLTCWDVEKIPSEPNGWGQQKAEGDNRLPLWGVPMSDMSQRYHSFCRLPTTPDPLPPIDEPMEFTVTSKDGESPTSLSLTVESVGTTEVHWGDGEVSRFAGAATVTHTYSDTGARLIKVLGLNVSKVTYGGGNSNVIEVNSFGEIGLQAVNLTPTDGAAVKYTVFPTKLPTSLKDLTEFARGYVAVDSNPFAQWDFSNLEVLDGFLKDATGIAFEFTGTELAKLTSLENFMRNASNCSLTVTSAELPELTNTTLLMAASISCSVTMTDVNLTKLVTTGRWAAGSQFGNINLTRLRLTAVQNINTWMSEGDNLTANISQLETPVLTSVSAAAFGQLKSTEPELRSSLSILGWSCPVLTSIGPMFSQSNSTDYTLQLSTSFDRAGITAFNNLFHSSVNCTVDMRNLQLPNDIEVGSLVNGSQGTYFSFHDWVLGDRVTLSGTFNANGTGNTFVLNGMEAGDELTLSNTPVGDLNDSTMNWNTVTLGHGANLQAAFSNVRGTLIANSWTMGDNANLQEVFSQVGGVKIEAYEWVIGTDANLNNAFAFCRMSDNVNSFPRWTVGESFDGALTIDRLAAQVRECTLDLEGWIFQGDVELTNLSQGSFDATIKLNGWRFNQAMSASNAVNAANDITFNVLNWDFGGQVILDNMFNSAGNVTIVGISSWVDDSDKIVSMRNTFKDFEGTGHEEIGQLDLSMVTDWYGCFAGCTPTKPLGFVDTLKLDSATDISYMFFGSGNISVDIGHYQVANVTMADNVFSPSSVQDLNQDLTCWKVQAIPTRPAGWDAVVDNGAIVEPLWGQDNDDMAGRTHGFCKIEPEVIPFPVDVPTADSQHLNIKVLAPINVDTTEDAFPLIWDNEPEEDQWLAALRPEKFVASTAVPYQNVNDLLETSINVTKNEYSGRSPMVTTSLPTGIILDFKGNTLEPFDMIFLAGSNSIQHAIGSFYVEALIEGIWTRVLTAPNLTTSIWRGFDTQIGFFTDVGLVTGATKLRVCIDQAVGGDDRLLMRGFKTWNTSEDQGDGDLPEDAYVFSLIPNPESSTPETEVNVSVGVTTGLTHLPVTVFWGDGTTDTYDEVSSNNGWEFSHTFAEPGEYQVAIVADRSQAENMPRIDSVRFRGDLYVKTLEYNGPGNRLKDLMLYPSVYGTVERENPYKYLTAVHYTFLEPLIKFQTNGLQGLPTALNGNFGTSLSGGPTEPYDVELPYQLAYLFYEATGHDLTFEFANFVNLTELNDMLDTVISSKYTFKYCQLSLVEEITSVMYGCENATLVFDNCLFDGLTNITDVFADCTGCTVEFINCTFTKMSPTSTTDSDGNRVIIS